MPAALTPSFNFQAAGENAIIRPAADKIGDIISAFDFIPADYHNAIRSYSSAVDVTGYINELSEDLSEAGGGTIMFPTGRYRGGNFMLRSGVTWVAQERTLGYVQENNKGTQFEAIGSPAWMIDTSTDDPAIGACIDGINIGGGVFAPNSGNTGGIRIRHGSWQNAFRNMLLMFFGEQAILLDGDSRSNSFDWIVALGSVYNRSREVLTGVVECSSTDNYFTRCEFNPSILSSEGTNGIINPALRICAMLDKGGTNFWTACIGEFAERGRHSTTRTSVFTAERCDHNWGLGISGTGLSIGSRSLNNSQSGSGLYDAFKLEGEGGEWIGPQAMSMAGNNQHRYGLNGSDANYAEVRNRHLVRGFRSSNHLTGAILQASDGALPHDIDALGAQVHKVIDGTPDVEGIGCLVPTNGAGAPVTVTDFLKGHNGQTLEVGGNPNITISNSGLINTNTGANKLLLAGRLYIFRKRNIGGGNFWYELGVQ